MQEVNWKYCMRPKMEQLSHQLRDQSFLCYELSYPSFEFYWHFHPEYELTYIVKGEGKRLVGDSYETFGAADLVLLPPYLPHTWITEPDEGEQHTAIIIQFSRALLDPFLKLKEFQGINRLFSMVDKGLHFPEAGGSILPDLIHRMSQSSGVDAFTGLLQLLDWLGKMSSLPLASAAYRPLRGNESEMRINQIFGYVQSNFEQELSLKKAAALVHLSESAFCKFFKRVSGKTFSDYVNEIRISNACRLLIETDLPVSAIAHESGFDSLTYFNRVFKKKKGQRPGEFRRIR